MEEAARRVLRVKLELGLFEDPRPPDAARQAAVIGCAEHAELNLDVARRSLVLLTNDGTLPYAAADDRPRTVAGVTRRLLHPGRPKDVLEVAGNVPFKDASGVPVDVWRSVVGDVTTFTVVNRGEPPADAYDNRHLPRFLLLGAAGLTFLNLLLIWRPLQRVRNEPLEA